MSDLLPIPFFISPSRPRTVDCPSNKYPFLLCRYFGMLCLIFTPIFVEPGISSLGIYLRPRPLLTQRQIAHTCIRSCSYTHRIFFPGLDAPPPHMSCSREVDHQRLNIHGTKRTPGTSETGATTGGGISNGYPALHSAI